ncbi:MAG: hypothetical protein SFT94_01265 [Pseudanabaenaceae cyanobacterium bins.68]|nr:hypothetical protein [Pseudanabaenaceae cyanobacterium bins.68]
MNESNLAKGLFGAKPKKSGRKGGKADPEITLPLSQSQAQSQAQDPIYLAESCESSDHKSSSGCENFLAYTDSWVEPGVGRQTPKKSTRVKPNLNAEFKPKPKQPDEQGHEQIMVTALEAEVKLLKLELVQKQQVEQQLRQQNQQMQLELEAKQASLMMLQRSLQEVTAQLDQPSDRLVELESQVVELQEQVLKQAGQAAEYEAAIQHWKEQSLHHQRHALQLSGALERLMDEQKSGKRTTKLEKELANFAPNGPKPLAEPEETKPSGKVNLPSFLMRQRPALS